jgi:hypothetical protein
MPAPFSQAIRSTGRPGSPITRIRPHFLAAFGKVEREIRAGERRVICYEFGPGLALVGSEITGFFQCHIHGDEPASLSPLQH